MLKAFTWSKSSTRQRLIGCRKCSAIWWLRARVYELQHVNKERGQRNYALTIKAHEAIDLPVSKLSRRLNGSMLSISDPGRVWKRNGSLKEAFHAMALFVDRVCFRGLLN